MSFARLSICGNDRKQFGGGLSNVGMFSNALFKRNREVGNQGFSHVLPSNSDKAETSV
jgi:hypothetical protein